MVTTVGIFKIVYVAVRVACWFPVVLEALECLVSTISCLSPGDL